MRLEFEALLIKLALTVSLRNHAKAARFLKIKRTTLVEKMRSLDEKGFNHLPDRGSTRETVLKEIRRFLSRCYEAMDDAEAAMG